jgi:hypothetical protein
VDGGAASLVSRGAVGAVEEEDATKHFEMVLYEWRTKFETAGCFRMDLKTGTGDLLGLYVSVYTDPSSVLKGNRM